MTGYEVVITHVYQPWFFFSTGMFCFRATQMKVAAGGWIERARRFAGDNDPFFLVVRVRGKCGRIANLEQMAVGNTAKSTAIWSMRPGAGERRETHFTDFPFGHYLPIRILGSRNA